MKNAKESLKRELLSLREIYGPKFVTNLESYRALLKRKRELGIKPISRIPKEVLEQYPKIPFFQMDDEEAQEYVSELSVSELKNLIADIREVLELNHSYHTVSNRVKEYSWQIRNHGCAKGFGINPDTVRGGRGRKGHCRKKEGSEQ